DRYGSLYDDPAARYLLRAVIMDLVAPGSVAGLADRLAHRRFSAADDVVGESVEINARLFQHGDQPVAERRHAGRHRPDITHRLIGYADVLADQTNQD